MFWHLSKWLLKHHIQTEQKRDQQMLQRLQQLVETPRCFAASRGGCGLFGYRSPASFLGGFIHLSSPQLLGEASHPSVSLHFGESNCVGASPPTVPALRPHGGTSPRSAHGGGGRNHRWCETPAHRHISRRLPEARRLLRVPGNSEQSQHKTQRQRLLAEQALAGDSPSVLGHHAKQPCFPTFSWARLNQFLKYNTSDQQRLSCHRTEWTQLILFLSFFFFCSQNFFPQLFFGLRAGTCTSTQWGCVRSSCKMATRISEVHLPIISIIASICFCFYKTRLDDSCKPPTETEQQVTEWEESCRFPLQGMGRQGTTDPTSYSHNINLDFYFYSFLFRFLKIVHYLLVLLSWVASMHLPPQGCIGEIQKATGHLGPFLWLHHQQKDIFQVHMQIEIQALCCWATLSSIAETLFDNWNKVLSSCLLLGQIVPKIVMVL